MNARLDYCLAVVAIINLTSAQSAVAEPLRGVVVFDVVDEAKVRLFKASANDCVWYQKLPDNMQIGAGSKPSGPAPEDEVTLLSYASAVRKIKLLGTPLDPQCNSAQVRITDVVNLHSGWWYSVSSEPSGAITLQAKPTLLELAQAVEEQTRAEFLADSIANGNATKFLPCGALCKSYHRAIIKNYSTIYKDLKQLAYDQIIKPVGDLDNAVTDMLIKAILGVPSNVPSAYGLACASDWQLTHAASSTDPIQWQLICSNATARSINLDKFRKIQKLKFPAPCKQNVSYQIEPDSATQLAWDTVALYSAEQVAPVFSGNCSLSNGTIIYKAQVPLSSVGEIRVADKYSAFALEIDPSQLDLAVSVYEWDEFKYGSDSLISTQILVESIYDFTLSHRGSRTYQCTPQQDAKTVLCSASPNNTGNWMVSHSDFVLMMPFRLRGK